MKNLKTDLEKPLNLLVVDQDEVSLLMHIKIAKATGLFKSIRLATNGLDAFDHINLVAEGSIHFPDIMLFDLDLPVMNGITLLKVLRKSDMKRIDKICFVVLASSVSDHEKEVAASLGVTAFLAKPLSAESLTDVITSIDRHHHFFSAAHRTNDLDVIGRTL